MTGENEERTLREYASILARRKWIVIFAVVIATVVAIVLTSLQTPIYSASSNVLVQPRGQDGFFQNQDYYIDSDRAIETEIQVIVGQEVRQRVQDDLGLAAPPTGASAAPVGTTDIVSITVVDANATNAATLANAYALAYAEVRREQAVDELLTISTELQAAIDDIQAELDTLEDDDPRRPALVNQLSNFNTTLDQLRVDAALRTGGVTLIRTATVPTVPIEPTPTRTAVLAAFVGLLIGLGAVFLLDYLDDKVRSESDLEALVDKPVLAVVPVDPPPDDRPISISEPGHAAVEAYRGLRTNVLFLALDRPISVIQITSSMAGEGKTTTSANLAVVLAQAGHRVALVDADLRRPRMHQVFGLPQSPGFIDLLLGAEAKAVVSHVDIDGGPRLSVYPSGAVPSNPSELLSGRLIQKLLTEMGAHYDYVVVDSAPILPVSDSVALSGAVDGVIVVAQAGRVSDDNVVGTVERLTRVSAPILGLVLNKASDSVTSGGYAYAYGGYASHPSHRRSASDDTSAATGPTGDDASTASSPASGHVIADFADGVDETAARSVEREAVTDGGTTAKA